MNSWISADSVGVNYFQFMFIFIFNFNQLSQPMEFCSPGFFKWWGRFLYTSTISSSGKCSPENSLSTHLVWTPWPVWALWCLNFGSSGSTPVSILRWGKYSRFKTRGLKIRNSGLFLTLNFLEDPKFPELLKLSIFVNFEQFWCSRKSKKNPRKSISLT